MEAAAASQRHRRDSIDCRAVARTGHVAESSDVGVDAAERAGAVSRVFVVFFRERAAFAIFEFAVSARLQHRAAGLFLAVSSGVAVSLERVLPGDCETVF